jgi:hypothetical protein
MSHWYTKDGKPLYTVLKADKKTERATTLSDARKLNLSPSVTTITRMLEKPFLNTWIIKETIKTTLEIKKKSKEELETYIKRVQAITNERLSKPSEIGTKIHDSFEKYFNCNVISEDTYSNFTLPVIEYLYKTFPGTEWEPELSFTHSLGFGGKVDLIGKNWLEDRHILIDFKTKNKEVLPEEKELKYIEQAMQLSAYKEGLQLKSPKYINIFISSITPGEFKTSEWKEEEIQEAWILFKHLLESWKIINKYDSAF